MQSSGGDDVRRDRCDHVSPLFTKVIAVGWGLQEKLPGRGRVCRSPAQCPPRLERGLTWGGHAGHICGTRKRVLSETTNCQHFLRRVEFKVWLRPFSFDFIRQNTRMFSCKTSTVLKQSSKNHSPARPSVFLLPGKGRHSRVTWLREGTTQSGDMAPCTQTVCRSR